MTALQNPSGAYSTATMNVLRMIRHGLCLAILMTGLLLIEDLRGTASKLMNDAMAVTDTTAILLRQQHVQQQGQQGLGAVQSESSTTENDGTSSSTADAVTSTRRQKEVVPETAQGTTQPTSYNYTTKFVFVLGIEGTGHHLLNSIIKQSPVLEQIKEIGVRTALKSLTESLFQQFGGYLHLHCGQKLPKQSESVVERSLETPKTMKRYMRFIAERMDAMNAERLKKYGPGNEMSVPLNLAGLLANMASYPQDPGPCRPLKYSDLHILYKICEDAGVRCEHVYIYRDPTSVIASTTVKRHFNRDIIQAMHLYTSMLSMIYGMMSIYPDRTTACIDLYDPKLTAQSNVWDPIRDLYGWSTNHTGFTQLVQDLYRPSHPLNATEIHNLGIHEFPLFMHSYQKMHDEVTDLCYRSVLNNPVAKKYYAKDATTTTQQL